MFQRSKCLASFFLLVGMLISGVSCAMQESEKQARRQSMEDAEPNDWETPIYEKLSESEIDQVIVRDPWKGDQLWTRELDKDDMKSLVEAIQIRPKESGFHCMCNGDFHLIFQSDDKEVITIGYHHHRSIRWHDGGWKGDGLLTTASRDMLIKWFDDRGFTKISENYAKELARKKAEEEEQDRFYDCFPIDALEAESSKDALAAFASPADAGVACCKALGGISYKSWSTTGGKERFALALGNELSGEDFLQSLDALDAEDQASMLGAARFFFWEDFGSKIPEDRRSEWTVKLAKVELNSDHHENKPLVMRRLSSLAKDPAIEKLLWKIARGETGIAAKQDGFNDEPNLIPAALLVLAEAGDPKSKPAIESQLKNRGLHPSDKAALEVGLVLLGNPNFIRAEHFQRESYSIGYAAIRAIERFKGQHGMKVLEEAGTEHPWALVSREAEEAVARLKEYLKKSKN